MIPPASFQRLVDATDAGHCPVATTSTETFDMMNGGKDTFNYECRLKRKGLYGRCIFRCPSSGLSLS